MYGGTGDDHVYGGYETEGRTYLYGNAGRDTIRTDWYRVNGKDDAINTGHEYIFGDYKYGEDALDEDLWGDADIIYGGQGDRTKNQKIYGGDGDDELHPGSAWKTSRVYGEGGDDRIYAPQATKKTARLYGGDGNDEWVVAAYGEVEQADRNKSEASFGGAGDDVVRGTHRAKGQSLYGGAGNDRVYGGDGAAANGNFQVMAGNDGDDWLQAGDNLAGDLFMYGDDVSPGCCSFESLGPYYDEGQYLRDRGDDVMYGGENIQGDQYLSGGYGDDQVFPGPGSEGDYVYAYGDQPEGNIDPYKLADGSVWSKYRGAPDDGDDIIVMGDHPDLGVGTFAYGNGGNDRIFGGIGQPSDRLYGGDGDDKLWANLPGTTQTDDGSNILYGGNGSDILYGSVKSDELRGDWETQYNPGIDRFDIEGGDDVIYTGEAATADDGSVAWGGAGDDKIYG